MIRHLPLVIVCVPVLCLLKGEKTARADTLPVVSITSATGEASWGGGTIGAFFSGPDFTLSFSAIEGPPNYLQETDQFAINSDSELYSFVGNNEFEYPSGTLNLGGTTYPVNWDALMILYGPYFVVTPGATFVAPGTLSGVGMVCIFSPSISQVCSVGSPEIAGLFFNVPGLLAITFSPEQPPNELFPHGYVNYSIVFTAVPEPSTVFLLPAGLLFIGFISFVRRLSRRGADFYVRFQSGI